MYIIEYGKGFSKKMLESRDKPVQFLTRKEALDYITATVNNGSSMFIRNFDDVTVTEVSPCGVKFGDENNNTKIKIEWN